MIIFFLILYLVCLLFDHTNFIPWVINQRKKYALVTVRFHRWKDDDWHSMEFKPECFSEDARKELGPEQEESFYVEVLDSYWNGNMCCAAVDKLTGEWVGDIFHIGEQMRVRTIPEKNIISTIPMKLTFWAGLQPKK